MLIYASRLLISYKNTGKATATYRALNANTKTKKVLLELMTDSTVDLITVIQESFFITWLEFSQFLKLI